MRIELAGSLIVADPLVIVFNEDADFDVVSYMELGYTHFDVICIGAGGGRGGGIDTANTGSLIRNYGGEGGGGGFHRVQGLLSALPTACPVVVGAAGTLGIEHSDNVGAVTDGGDGGFSSFNDPTCRASGGKGGKKVESNSSTIATVADGGEGGLGDRVAAGGGASGGVAGIPTDTGPGTPGLNADDGQLFQNIGEGGGGGAGGVGKYGSGGITCVAGTNGGRGSYNPGDITVSGPGDLPSDDPGSGALSIKPGIASGAKAAPLSGLPTVHGQSNNPGVVVIRLTAE
jgi:hypothetical protein